MTGERKPGEELGVELGTVEGAWAAFDLEERELWAEYASKPTYLAGRVYLAGERLMRQRCERTVERIRYRLRDGAKA